MIRVDWESIKALQDRSKKPLLEYSTNPDRYNIVLEAQGIFFNTSIFKTSSEGIEYENDYRITSLRERRYSVSNNSVGFTRRKSGNFRMILAIRFDPSVTITKNFVRLIDLVLNVDNNGNKVYNVHRNATLSQAVTWQSINNSILQYAVENDNKNPTLSGGEILYTLPESDAANSRFPEVINFDEFMLPTDVIAVSISSDTNNNVNASFNWSELK